jgi:hypothetical protein
VPYTDTQEHAEMMSYLVEELGVEPSEAEVSLRDGDVFPLIDAGSMHPFEGQEAVEQWEDARETLHKLYEFYAEFDYNPALLQTLGEAEERTSVMLERARGRARSE